MAIVVSVVGFALGALVLLVVVIRVALRSRRRAEPDDLPPVHDGAKYIVPMRPFSAESTRPYSSGRPSTAASAMPWRAPTPRSPVSLSPPGTASARVGIADADGAEFVRRRPPADEEAVEVRAPAVALLAVPALPPVPPRQTLADHGDPDGRDGLRPAAAMPEEPTLFTPEQ